MNYKLRPKPVIPSMPRFAPPGSVLLMVALDRLGKAMDPAWTGEEILSVPIKELSDTDLEFSAFKTGLREGETRFEADILAELRERYEEEIAPRRRRQAVVLKILQLLHGGILKVIAFGSNGRLYESVPDHVWAADGAEEVFDTGVLAVSGDEVTFNRGLTLGGDNGPRAPRTGSFRASTRQHHHLKSGTHIHITQGIRAAPLSKDLFRRNSPDGPIGVNAVGVSLTRLGLSLIGSSNTTQTRHNRQRRGQSKTRYGSSTISLAADGPRNNRRDRILWQYIVVEIRTTFAPPAAMLH
jgi:hypothetical protein